MIGIDSATAARPHGRPEAPGASVLEDLAEFSSEYFVEWQVADHAVLGPSLTPEK